MVVVVCVEDKRKDSGVGRCLDYAVVVVEVGGGGET